MDGLYGLPFHKHVEESKIALFESKADPIVLIQGPRPWSWAVAPKPDRSIRPGAGNVVGLFKGRNRRSVPYVKRNVGEGRLHHDRFIRSSVAASLVIEPSPLR